MHSEKYTIGIDLGTSGVKVLLLHSDHTIIAQTHHPLTVQHPQPLHSEQAPQDWWLATDHAMCEMAQLHPSAMQAVTGIGLAGQMHGVVLLDGAANVLRPALLWNDGRSSAECAWLTQAVPQLRAITGNIAMPGFSAPKLLWVRTHEPELFAQIQTVLLPKDFLRLRMTGKAVSDMSDAAGTLWLDVQKRAWSPLILQACGLGVQHMPTLCEGDATSATLLPEWAQRWGMHVDGKPPIVMAGGAGDNAASAVGLGLQAGEGFVSLGTSGVVFINTVTLDAVQDFALPQNPTVHTFCHAHAQRWHRMSVMLSCAASIDWAVDVLGIKDAATLMDIAQLVSAQAERRRDAPLFLPYLAGERSPHNNAHATGAWHGLKAHHRAPDVAYAVLEGVCFGLYDGYLSVTEVQGDTQDEVQSQSQPLNRLLAVGGMSQSAACLQQLADTFNLEMAQVDFGWAGAALGAARLARIAAGDTLENACPPAQVTQTFAPSNAAHQLLTARHQQFQQLYLNLASTFVPPVAGA